MIKEIPKVELHIHLDGSISKKMASSLSGKNIDEVIPFMVAPDKCENLSEYLTKFDFPISLMQTAENLYVIAKDLVDYLEQEGVIYAEIRFAPMFHTKEGLTMEEVVEAVRRGVNSNTHVKTNLILCMMRGMDKKENIETIEVAEKYLHHGVCALDLAGDECKYPLDNYLYLFQEVQKREIPFTIHAGENGPASEIEKAIHVGAKRIGHGISSIESKKTLDLIKEENVLLEVCPTSNVQTNAISTYEEHPIYKFHKMGVLVNINTDNTTVSNITLSEEYEKLSYTFGFSLSDYEKMNEYAIEHAFIDDEMKHKLRSILRDKMKICVNKVGREK